MPVPTTITDLSDTAASNFPQDADSTGATVASLPRAIQAILKKQFIRGSDIPVLASGTVTIPVDNNYFVITGTGFSVSGFSANYNGRMITVEFTGALTLTHSASFIMPAGASITTATGDVFIFVNETGSTWRCVNYTKAGVDYAPLASPVFTGNPTAPTPTAGDNDTSIATTAFVVASFATLASPAFTGNPTAPTASVDDNDTSIATTAFVRAQIRSKIVSATRVISTATGTQAITGVGFTPKLIIALGMVSSTLTRCTGMSTGLVDICNSIFGTGAASQSASLLTFAVDPSNYSIGSVQSYDSDGLTISWVKTGSPTGTANFYLLCLGW